MGHYPCLDFIELAPVAFINRRKTVSVKTEIVARTRSERKRALLLCGAQRGGVPPCGVGVRTSPKTLENNASDKQNVKFSALFRVTGRKVLIGLVRDR